MLTWLPLLLILNHHVYISIPNESQQIFMKYVFFCLKSYWMIPEFEAFTPSNALSLNDSWGCVLLELNTKWNKSHKMNNLLGVDHFPKSNIPTLFVKHGYHGIHIRDTKKKTIVVTLTMNTINWEWICENLWWSIS